MRQHMHCVHRYAKRIFMGPLPKQAPSGWQPLSSVRDASTAGVSVQLMDMFSVWRAVFFMSQAELTRQFNEKLFALSLPSGAAMQRVGRLKEWWMNDIQLTYFLQQSIRSGNSREFNLPTDVVVSAQLQALDQQSRRDSALLERFYFQWDDDKRSINKKDSVDNSFDPT